MSVYMWGDWGGVSVGVCMLACLSVYLSVSESDTDTNPSFLVSTFSL